MDRGEPDTLDLCTWNVRRSQKMVGNRS